MKLLALLFAALLPLAAQTPIACTVNDATGNGINGTMMIQAVFPFVDTVTGKRVNVAPVSVVLRNGNCVPALSLVSTTNSNPPNAYYKVQYKQGARVWSTYWPVPASEVAVNINVFERDTPPGSIVPAAPGSPSVTSSGGRLYFETIMLQSHIGQSSFVYMLPRTPLAGTAVLGYFQHENKFCDLFTTSVAGSDTGGAPNQLNVIIPTPGSICADFASTDSLAVVYFAN